MSRATATARYGEALTACETMGCAGSELALQHLSRSVFLAPEEPHFYALRAQAMLMIGDVRGALVCLRHVLTLLPSDSDRLPGLRLRLAQLLDLEGLCRLRGRDFVGARDAFTEALEMQPLQPSLYLHRAVARTFCREYEPAVRDTEMVLELGAGNIDVALLRAKLFLQLGISDKAREVMAVAESLDPGHPTIKAYRIQQWKASESEYHRATSCMLVRDFPAAITHLTTAIHWHPSDFRYLLLRAGAYRSMGDFAKSLEDIESAATAWQSSGSSLQATTGLMSSPTAGSRLEAMSPGATSRPPHPSPVTLATAGSRASDAGAPGEASPQPSAPALVEHTDITHQRNLTLNALALNQHIGGEYRNAVAIFSSVIESEERLVKRTGREVDKRFFSNRGDSYKEMGMLSKALEDYTLAYERDPADLDLVNRVSMVNYMWGVESFNKGLYLDAVAHFSQALKLKPRSPSFLTSKGEALLNLKDLDGAKQCFEKALRCNPHHPAALRHMALFR